MYDVCQPAASLGEGSDQQSYKSRVFAHWSGTKGFVDARHHPPVAALTMLRTRGNQRFQLRWCLKGCICGVRSMHGGDAGSTKLLASTEHPMALVRGRNLLQFLFSFVSDQGCKGGICQGGGQTAFMEDPFCFPNAIYLRHEMQIAGIFLYFGWYTGRVRHFHQRSSPSLAEYRSGASPSFTRADPGWLPVSGALQPARPTSRLFSPGCVSFTLTLSFFFLQPLIQMTLSLRSFVITTLELRH